MVHLVVLEKIQEQVIPVNEGMPPAMLPGL